MYGSQIAIKALISYISKMTLKKQSRNNFITLVQTDGHKGVESNVPVDTPTKNGTIFYGAGRIYKEYIKIINKISQELQPTKIQKYNILNKTGLLIVTENILYIVD